MRLHPPARILAALLAVSLPLAAGCSPPPPATAAQRELVSFLGDAAGDWAAAEAEARGAISAGEWDRAEAAWEKRIALYPAAKPDVPRPGVADLQVSVDLYNLACARAQAGKSEAALDALDQSMAGGAGFVGFDHLAGDPDLRSLHVDPRWGALLRRLSWNDDVEVIGPGSPAQRRWPLVVRLGSAEGLPETVTALPRAPYALSPEAAAWTTRLDRGERAAEKVAFAVEAAGRQYGLEPARRVLVAVGKGEAAVAWEVLLRRQDLFTAAVLAGDAPPDWDLLDRGAEKVRARILVVGEGAAPAPSVPVKTERAATLADALAEALR